MNTLKRIEAQCQQFKLDLEAKHQWRSLAPVLPKNCIDFSSNDYLGLRSAGYEHDAFKASVGAGASRLVLQFHARLNELEAFCAQWLGWPATLYCASGFVANLSIFDAVSRFEDAACFVDVRAHASFHVATRAAKITPEFFQHKDYRQLENRLKSSSNKVKFIFVESLHSMDGDFEDAYELEALCKKYDCALVVDEAHSAGLFGAHGEGWLSQFPELKKHVLAVMFGCGKAFGVSGGLIAASQFFIDHIVNVSKSFIYSTAPSPLVVEAVFQSVVKIKSDEGGFLRTQLQSKIKLASLLKQNLNLKNLICESGSPILSYRCESDKEALSLSEFLAEKGFFVRAMRPPTVPRGTSRVRLVLRANLNDASIQRLCELLQEFEHARA